MIIVKEDKNEEVSWNLSQFLITEIGTNLNRASNFYLQCNFNKCFACLKTIEMRLVAYLSNTEQTKLEDIEKKFLNNQKYVTPNAFKKRTQEQEKGYHNLWVALNEYNNTILRLLKKYGLLIPIKIDNTKMNA